MPDRYENFAELAEHETGGTDYRIRVLARDLSAAIIAPHGGQIEPGTTELAVAIAGKTYCLYLFEGIRKNRPHGDLHVTSTRFDEPLCLELIGRCDRVLALHGLAGTGSNVYVGGLDTALRDEICTALNAAGFVSEIDTSGSHAANSPDNICNKGRQQAGAQLELTRGLRDNLRDDEDALSLFARSVRQAISQALQS
ncbi:poly-gamma-glutamate hydrolase family protein [Dongia soli]|uniref:Poly-gamma-glutamate hydrolase family protein n=1 Tax=Dongia soli TaxID=600628 RepID=A0ABU5EH31_9PROT|nr:poly-gamma-glutamate hydrolase family protein [Dongia soli]MDY0885202.1 poly-gamma-glutamate hydrolase family protein [Dongia soli]